MIRRSPLLAALILLLGAACAWPEPGDRSGALPAPTRAEFEARGSARVLIALAEVERFGAESGLEPTRVFEAIGWAEFTLATPADLRAADRSDASLFEDEVLRAHGDLDRYLGLASPHAAGVRGAGARVAVLDTGVDWAHADFGACAMPGRPGCSVIESVEIAPSDGLADDLGHGSNVAAAVLRTAPEAGIVSLDVFDDEIARGADVLAALDWVVVHASRLQIEAVNMSLGAGRYAAACDQSPYTAAVAALGAIGVSVIASSGNDGWSAAAAAPACAPGVISVGALYHEARGAALYPSCADATSAPGQVACFSNAAPFLSILAPGVGIEGGGRTLSGTSQAAPLVAGAIALIATDAPSLAAPDRLARLVAGAARVYDGRNGGLWPRLDLGAAFAKGAQAPKPEPEPIDSYSGAALLQLGAPAVASPRVGLLVWAPSAGAAAEICVRFDESRCGALDWEPLRFWSWRSLPGGDGSKRVRVSWRGAGEERGELKPDSIVLDRRPPRPPKVRVRLGPRSWSVRWSGARDRASGVSHYRVVRGESASEASCQGRVVWRGEEGPFEAPIEPGGPALFYRVCAVDRAGNASGSGAIRIEG